ncbi:hypothetical protein F5Y11DRAFT_6940 [Daldinia sp. FL1419]|nr:hypothetical protein F5Y11DRAFT_6940 [Daldinia sp. FL1419]
MVSAPPSTSATGGLPPFLSTSSSNPTLDSSLNPSSNVFTTALDTLQPLQPILRGFNHRNRNQHRRAAWWAPFGMLRRHVEKVVDELLEAGAAVEKSKAKSTSSSKKRRRDEEDGGGNVGKLEKKVTGHVEWLRDVLIPKCYLAFSQLTADNQFATLGVVLLGALAQINAACVGLVGEAPELSHAEVGTSTPREPIANNNATTRRAKEPSTQGPKEPPSRPIAIKAPDERGGSVISRDEVEKLRRKKPAQTVSSDTPGPPNRNQDSNRDHNDSSTAVKKQQGKSSKEKTKESSRPPKKKKTKKGGDEFDDLFKGLF